MLHSSNTSAIQHHEFQHGLRLLKSRRNRMRLYLILAVIVACMSAVILYFNQQLIYAFYDISPIVQQLHVPYSAYQIQNELGSGTDYFSQLFLWVFWLGLKITGSLIGSAVVLHYVKKISYFRQLIRGFVQNVLAWIISIILIWMGLAYVQLEVVNSHREHQHIMQAVAYKNNIYDSKIYRYIQSNTIDQTVVDYLLLQTALMHRPVDKEVALGFAQQLITAEQKNPQNFRQYGFKTSQLWTMQYQLYGKAITPLAQSVQKQVNQANMWVYYSKISVSILFGLSFLAILIFYGLNRQLTHRIQRIDTQLLGK